MRKVIVIGGGSSGMIAAIFAASRGHDVRIIEHNDKLGRKLSVTGNGKCNLTNRRISSSCYHGTEPSFVNQVFSAFSVEDSISFFKKIGIRITERDGYCYPQSEQASSVTAALSFQLQMSGVHITLSEDVTEVLCLPSEKERFTVKTNLASYHADCVVLATGGFASPVYGASGIGYDILRKMGHTIVEPLPALTQLITNHKLCKLASGVRAHCEVRMEKCSERGEIIFTDHGISGIPVFSFSAIAARTLYHQGKVGVFIDLFPDDTLSELTAYLISLRDLYKERPLEELFWGICNKKLTYAVLLHNRVSDNPSLRLSSPAGQFSDEDMKMLAGLFKRIYFDVQQVNDFTHAQVTSGGLLTKEVNPETMESKRVNGLYVIGELLDIDGICGGYNLQWAWSTGAICGSNI